jgi:sugar diacid utilization regulator
MAAPLLIRGEMIGVLEVWRRRRSPFGSSDVARLVGLTNLAAIAIDNAHLFDQAQSSLTRLAAAERTLSEQVAALQQAADIHLTLSEVLLEEQDLHAMARTVAIAVGGDVAIMSASLTPLAVSPRLLDVDRVAPELSRILERHPQGVSGVELTTRPGWLTAQPVRPGLRPGGWVCVLTAEPPTAMTDIVTASASTHTALWQVQNEAAERALAQTKERMLCDLVEGSPEQRRAAASRATRMRIDLQRPMRVVVGSLHGVAEHAADHGWDSTRIDEFRRSLRARFARIVSQAGAELSDLYGDRFVAILPEIGDLDRLVDDLTDRLTAAETLTTRWGISGVHCRPDELGVALEEAEASMRVASRLGRKDWAVFDRLGLLQYLVGPVESAGLDAFATEVLGPLLQADDARPGGGELVATLRAYLEANCSQQGAAKQLYVHHKTMRYRIERIEQLTGLDLRTHADRVRADVALKIHDMTAPT